MSTLLSIPNFDPINIKEIGRVDFDAPAGQAIVKFNSVQGIIDNDTLFIGRLGTESAEKLVVQSIADPNVTFATNLAKEHRRYQPIVALRGNQLKVYRAPNTNGTSPAVGIYTLMSGMPVDIDPDQSSTNIQDSSGGSDYWYRYTYYNSLLTTETSLEEATAVRGGSYGHYASVSAIRDKAGFANNINIGEGKINDARIAAEDEINTELTGFYSLPFTEPIPPRIREITLLLGAGRLLNDEYGPFSSGGSSKRGDSKLKEGRALLAQVKAHDATILDEILVSLQLEGSRGVSSWPNNDTLLAVTPTDQGGSDRSFRIGDPY